MIPTVRPAILHAYRPFACRRSRMRVGDDREHAWVCPQTDLLIRVIVVRCSRRSRSRFGELGFNGHLSGGMERDEANRTRISQMRQNTAMPLATCSDVGSAPAVLGRAVCTCVAGGCVCRSSEIASRILWSSCCLCMSTAMMSSSGSGLLVGCARNPKRAQASAHHVWEEVRTGG